MRLPVALAVSLAAIGITPGFASSSAPAFSPGEWEFTRTVTGGPRNPPPQIARICVTQADIDGDSAAPIYAGVVRGEEGPDCAISDAAFTADGSASARMSCTGRMGKMRTDLEGAASESSFDLRGKMKVSFFSANINYTGRRLGDCDAQ